MTEVQGRYHDVFRNLVGTAFDHQDGVPGACNAQIEIGGFQLAERGIGHEFIIYASNPYSANRPVPGDIGNQDRC